MVCNVFPLYNSEALHFAAFRVNSSSLLLNIHGQKKIKMEEEQRCPVGLEALRNETRAIAKRNVMQEQVEKEIGENPRPGSKQSSQHSVGIHCTAVSSCRPIRHRAAVLQSARGERERRWRRGGRGVPHCRYESKWRRQEERRIIAAAYSAITLSRTEQPHFTQDARPSAQRKREREVGTEIKQRHHNFHDWTFLPSIFKIARIWQ